ncbi:MAG: glycosyltransferase family 4 protein [Planctomycetota bacterium]
MLKPDGSDQRPAVAIVANCVAPYRVHLHAALAASLDGFRLLSVFTHAKTDFEWQVDLPPEIHATAFSEAGEDPSEPLMRHPKREYRKGRRIWDYLVRERVRFVICHGYNSIANLTVARAARKAGVPVVLRGDSNIYAEHRLPAWKRGAKRVVIGRLLRGFDAVMAAGQAGREYFAYYGVPEGRIFTVPFLPDYDALGLGADRRASDGRRKLLFAGRLVDVKRVDLLVDAFVALAQERPTWDLVIAGDGPLRESLAARVPEPLKPRVEWLGFCEFDRIVEVYASSDLLVLPSDFEPWALVVQEAMAAGLAVVCTDVVGAAHDLVIDRVSGRRFGPGRLDELIEALRDATDETSLATYRDGARRVLAEFREAWDPAAGLHAAMKALGVDPSPAPAPQTAEATT